MREVIKNKCHLWNYKIVKKGACWEEKANTTSVCFCCCFWLICCCSPCRISITMSRSDRNWGHFKLNLFCNFLQKCFYPPGQGEGIEEKKQFIFSFISPSFSWMTVFSADRVDLTKSTCLQYFDKSGLRCLLLKVCSLVLLSTNSWMIPGDFSDRMKFF